MPKLYVCPSDLCITTRRKKRHQFEKLRIFLKTVVETFCATCTVTGYPCFIMMFAKVCPK